MKKQKLSGKRARRAYLTVAILIIAPVLCRAAAIKIGFAGAISSVYDPCGLLEGKVTTDTLIAGYYIYESLTPDTNPATTVGDYWHTSAPCGIYANAGNLVFQTNSTDVDFLVEMVNNHGSSQDDGYVISK